MNHRRLADRFSCGAGRSPITAGVAPVQTKFLQDLALFAHAPMLKASPDRFDHRSGSACRLRL
jgi:hypothetical protein